MNRELMLVAVVTGLVAACSPGADPERPANVPASASWAGNVEGGTWIACEPVPSTSDRYACRAWFRTGAMISEGQYLLRQRSWNQQALRSEYREATSDVLPGYKTFDGRWIMLKNDHVLLPDGVINYPDSAGHGKRQSYSLGIETGAAEEY
ncbi:MAG: hypothetical protein R3F27_00730 [Gammaproteobacteria bacterium]